MKVLIVLGYIDGTSRFLPGGQDLLDKITGAAVAPASANLVIAVDPENDAAVCLKNNLHAPDDTEVGVARRSS